MAGDIRIDLENIEAKYKGRSELMCGKNILTLANKLNSSRALMWGSQTDQITVLENPETPRMPTGHENLVGKYSSAYYKADNDKQVVAKISKFGDNDNHIYILVIYDKKKHFYDIIERVPGEKLTETYGYKYNNEVIDSLKEDDVINKGEVLFKSTSFDENMNYGYGINANTLYITDDRVIEDPIAISYSLRDKLVSIEYDVIKISLNDNDLLLNLYGDNTTYKCFSDIGEQVVDSMVAVKRRINYAEALFSLQNMKKILSSDIAYYAPHDIQGTMVDISIYCNKQLDEIPNNPFNQQLIKYLKLEEDYNQQIVEVLGNIMESGAKYSDNLSEIYIRAKRRLDPERKWQDHNKKVFNNMVMYLTIEKRVPVVVGSKLCGRFGDKGVISSIVPDDEMPILETGERCEMRCSIIGVGARLNGGQLIEVELSFLGNRVIDKMRAVKGNDNKKKILLRFLEIACDNPGNNYKNIVEAEINAMNPMEQASLFEYLEETYDVKVLQPPMENISIEQIGRIYDEFNIKPMRAYVEKFGRLVPILRPVVMGQKYIVKLKHHPKSKMSARSTGFINSKDLPTKSASSKQNQAVYSNTALKFGEMEITNLLMNMNPRALDHLNMLYSSSVVGRRAISQIYEGDITPDNIELGPNATNRNAEIFRVYLKSFGVGLKFKGEDKF